MTQPIHYRPLNIDFMYIDLTTCGRCLGTEEALDAAIQATAPVLAALGFEPVLRKTWVRSEAQATALAFRSSPTIRVDGHDVASQLVESNCKECGDLCGENTDCRVWPWRGEDHTAAPTGMLVEAIVSAALSQEERRSRGTDRPAFALPDNLVRFFASLPVEARAKPDSSATNLAEPCCAPGCCERA